MDHGENCVMMNFIACILQIKEDEVGGTCGTHGGGERCVMGFWSGGPKEETTWKS
jgi:hypothetical protein